MRGKNAIVNTIFALIEQIVAIICGFILPRLILVYFGSKYNGLITSVTQFLTCAVLLRSGIGGATRAALYKPLAKKDKDEINSIVKATDIFMKKIGFILISIIILFSLIYPIFVLNEFEYIFTATLFLIIGMSTFAESFFGITYLIVLQADQKLWVTSLLKSICYILNIVISVILLKLNFGIHIVKLGSALIYVIYPIVLQIYVRKKYKINLKVEPNNNSIKQRWDSFWHQVATFTMSNTDVIVLTLFTNMLTVSVYSVYRLVVSALERTIQSFSSGLEAAFGNMIANKEKETLENNANLIEFLLLSVSSFVFSIAMVTILPFINIYTKDINDVNYIRPVFAFIILLAQYFNSIRIPYQTIVQAAGKYKETKKGAIIEPIINICISIIGVIKFGLVGVAIGTLVATIFRTIQYSKYMCDNIVNKNYFISIKKIIISLLEILVVIIPIYFLKLPMVNNFYYWILEAAVIAIYSFIIIWLFSIIFYKNEIKILNKKIIKILRK